MILVGTSGWQYADWRGRFYPADLPQRLWLEHYADAFATVEVNNAFYRLPDRRVFQGWRDRTPADFLVGVKCSRYLTHIKRLRDPAEPVARFLDRACALGDRLGPVLLQFPPNLRCDLTALDDVLGHFRDACERMHLPGVRVAVEPRHVSWWTDGVRACLAAHGAALCWADRRGRPVTPLWRTADFGYLRLHEGRATPRPRYGPQALHGWIGRVAEAFGSDPDVFVYFNNDHGAAAITDAVAFAGAARRRGFEVTRTDAAGSVRLAS